MAERRTGKMVEKELLSSRNRADSFQITRRGNILFSGAMIAS